MEISNKLINAVVASVMSAGLCLISTDTQAATNTTMEKCYGIVKKGKNDCGTKTHGCSGHAPQNSDPNEWIFLPKGSCEKIVGGNLTSAEGVSAGTPQS